MGVNIFELFGEVGVKDKGAHKKIDDITDKAKKANEFITKGLTGIGSGLTSMGTKVTVGVGVAVGALAGLGAKINDVTATVRAMDEQFEQTFKDNMEGAMNAISKQVEEQGIHVDRLKSAWSSFYGSFKGAGHDANQSLKLTERYMNLAGDAAAYYDMSLEDVNGRLKSLMMGNFQAGDAIGLNVSATSLGIEANKRYGKSWQELTQEEKDFLLIDVAEGIYKASGAMGQGAREANNWENVMGNLNSSFRRFVETVGSPILDSSVGIIKNLGRNIEELTEFVKKLDFSNLTDFIKQSEGLNNIIDGLFGSIKNGLQWLSKLDKESLNLYSRFVSVLAVTGPLLLGMGGIFNLAGKLSGGFSLVTGAINKLGSPVAGLVKKLGALSNAFPKTTRRAVRFGRQIEKVSKLGQTAILGLAKAFAFLGTIMNLGFWGVAIGGVLALLGALPEGVRDNINEMINIAKVKIPEFMETLTGQIEEKLPEFIKNGAELFANFGDMIIQALPAISEAIQTLLRVMNSSIKDNQDLIFGTAVAILVTLAQAIVDNMDELLTLGLTIIQGLAKAIKDNAEEIGSVAIDLITTLLEAIIEAAPALADAAIEIVLALADGIIQNADKIAPAAAGIIKALGKSFKDNPVGVTLIGAWIVNKLTKGILTALTGKSLFGHVGGAFVKGLGGGIVGAFGKLKGLLTGGGLLGVLGKVKGALGGLGTVLAGISGPIWLLIGAVSALISGLVYLYQTNETVRDAINITWQAIKDTAVECFEIIIGKLQEFWTWLQTLTGYILEMDWGGAWTFLTDTVKGIFGGFVEWIKAKWSEGKEFIIFKLAELQAVWNSIWDSVKNYVSNVWQGISDGIRNKFSQVADWVKSKLDDLKTKWNNIWSKFKEIVRNQFEGVKTAISNGINSAVQIVKNKAREFWNAGKHIIDMIISGIKEKAAGIGNAVRGALQRARNLLPFSPPKDKTSPMYGIERNGIAEMIAKGIDRNADLVYQSVKDMMDVDDLLTVSPDILAKGKLAGYTFGQDSPYSRMMDGLSEIKDLMAAGLDQEAYLMDAQNRQIRASGTIYMDSREVSKGIDEPLRNYQDAKDSIKSRTRGDW